MVLLSAMPLAANEEKTKSYVDETKAFSFNYPADWNVPKSEAGKGAVVVPDAMERGSYFHIDVSVAPRGADAILAEISSNYIEDRKKDLKDFVLLSSETFDYQGGKAQRILFSGTPVRTRSGPIEFMQIFAFQNGKLISFFCCAPAAKFNQERIFFDRIIDSFGLGAKK